jgi:hypothetical protein
MVSVSAMSVADGAVHAQHALIRVHLHLNIRVLRPVDRIEHSIAGVEAEEMLAA